MASKLLVSILVVVGMLALVTISGLLLMSPKENVEFEFKPTVIKSTEAIKYSLGYGTYEVTDREQISSLLKVGYLEVIPSE